jgi:hypothetical protein
MRLRDYLKITDPTPVIAVSQNLGSGINRNEIETAILGAGYSLPTTGMSFYIMDTSKAWIVRYFPPLDKYGVEKLTMK